MCSSQGLCRDRPSGRSSRTSSSGSGAHYALCAVGVGMIALGIVMIVWTVIPRDGGGEGATATSGSTPMPGGTTRLGGNVTKGQPGGGGGGGGSGSGGSGSGGGDDQRDPDDEMDDSKTSSVAFVLVGVGAVMLLLAICLGLKSKGPPPAARQQAGGAATYQDVADGESAEEPAPAYDVPTYDEVVGTDTYPVRDSNLRSSIAHLPSYEDILAAVENDGAPAAAAAAAAAEGAEPGDQTPSEVPASPDTASPGNGAADGAVAAVGGDPTPDPVNAPARSSSRASRILRPLMVRRNKSDKLHLKAFRLYIRSPTHNPVTIEPITPPPLYDDDKPPELA